jgi:hypothetical protein
MSNGVDKGVASLPGEMACGKSIRDEGLRIRLRTGDWRVVRGSGLADE